MSKLRRSTAAAGVCLLLAGLSAGLAANETRTAPAMTGPLLAVNPAALPVGVWCIEPYLSLSRRTGSFDDQGNYHRAPAQRQWGLAVPIQYGLTPDLSVHIILNGVYRPQLRGGGAETGDSVVRLLYQLNHPAPASATPLLSLSLSQSVATGRYRNLPATLDQGVGSGSWNTALALNSQSYLWLSPTDVLRVRANLSWTVRAPLSRVDGRSGWDTPADFDGQLRPGRQTSLDLSAEYSWGSPWVLVAELVYTRFERSRLYQRPSRSSPRQLYASQPGGATLAVAPAIEYNWNSRIGLIGGLELIPAGRNSARQVIGQLALNMVF